jgi:hypothetical protein
MTDDLLEASDHSRVPGPARRNNGAGVEFILRLATAIGLVVDGLVHLHDATFYDFANGGAITEGDVFRAEAAAAALVVVVLLFWRHRIAWLIAFAVSASALGAVLLYTYVDVGALGFLPNMYEPTWSVPGKVLAAWAEAAAVLMSSLGIIRAYLLPFIVRWSRSPSPESATTRRKRSNRD